MLKHFLQKLKLAKPPDRGEFDYDRHCLFDAERDDIGRLNRIVSTYNIAKVARCFDPELLDAILLAASEIYKAREAVIAADAVPQESKLNFRRRTIPLDELVSTGFRAASLTLPEVIIEAARHYLGKEPTQATSSVRAIVPGPDDQRLPFHQDQTILQCPLLNVWIPLTPCGVTAPGLEVAVTNGRTILEVIGSKDDEVPVERVRIDESLVLQTFGATALWRPQMKPGDVLIFTGTTAHRTFVSSKMTEPRLSIEARLV